MKKPEQKKRGAGIVTALIVGTLVLTLGFTVAAVAFNHLTVSTRLSNVAIAENHAEAALGMAIERLIIDQTFGTLGTETVTTPVLAGSPAGSIGVVTFSATDAATHDVDRSFQNLGSDTSDSADNGTAVPKESVYLVAVGKCANVEKRIETLIHMPRFPYSIASSGDVNGSGLLVAGLKDGVSIPYGSPPNPDDLVPGHLASNGTSNDAITLTGDNTIKGDVKSAGGADLSAYNPGTGSGTLVEGEQLLQSDVTEIPDVDIASYRPDLTDPATNQSLSSLESNLHLSGQNYYSGNMDINNGLTLDGGVLFVEGDLHITGGIDGKGAVITTGSLTVDGGGSAATDNLAALLSGGNFTMRGDTGDLDTARFEGLVYTEGDFNIADMTVQGVFVANSSGGSEMTVHNTHMYQQEVHSTVTIGGGGVHAFEVETTFDQTQTPPAGSQLDTMGFPSFTIPAGARVDVSHLWDSGLNQHKIVFKRTSPTPPYNVTYHYKDPDGVEHLTTGPESFPAIPIDADTPINFDGTDYFSISDARDAMIARFTSMNGGTPPTGAELAEIDTMLNEGLGDPGFILGFYDFHTTAQNESSYPPPSAPGSGDETRISVSDLLNPEDRMRIIYMKAQNN